MLVSRRTCEQITAETSSLSNATLTDHCKAETCVMQSNTIQEQTATQESVVIQKIKHLFNQVFTPHLKLFKSI